MYYNGMTGVFQLKLSSCKRCQIGITYRLLQLKGISANYKLDTHALFETKNHSEYQVKYTRS